MYFKYVYMYMHQLHIIIVNYQTDHDLLCLKIANGLKSRDMILTATTGVLVATVNGLLCPVPVVRKLTACNRQLNSFLPVDWERGYAITCYNYKIQK